MREHLYICFFHIYHENSHVHYQHVIIRAEKESDILPLMDCGPYTYMLKTIRPLSIEEVKVVEALGKLNENTPPLEKEGVKIIKDLIMDGESLYKRMKSYRSVSSEAKAYVKPLRKKPAKQVLSTGQI